MESLRFFIIDTARQTPAYVDVQVLFKVFLVCEETLSTLTSHFEMSALNDVANMFDDATAFNVNISGWDVSSLTNMRYMFDHAMSVQAADITRWDTRSLTNSYRMFEAATTWLEAYARIDGSSSTNGPPGAWTRTAPWPTPPPSPPPPSPPPCHHHHFCHARPFHALALNATTITSATAISSSIELDFDRVTRASGFALILWIGVGALVSVLTGTYLYYHDDRPYGSCRDRVRRSAKVTPTNLPQVGENC